MAAAAVRRGAAPATAQVAAPVSGSRSPAERRELRDGRVVEYRIPASGALHRDEGPAWVCTDYPRTEEWYQHGKLHREDGPARIDQTGMAKWYRNGVLHREDGPAVTGPGGFEEYWINGKLHREDGPAAVGALVRGLDDRDRFYYRNGQLHRKDGPAVRYANGVEEWFANDEPMGRIEILRAKRRQQRG